MIDEKKDYPPDCFTVTDSYGISYLMLPEGVNPIAELDHRYLSMLINSVGNHFDTVILDVGTCFSKENIRIISCANDIIFFFFFFCIGALEGYIGKKQSERTSPKLINAFFCSVALKLIKKYPLFAIKSTFCFCKMPCCLLKSGEKYVIVL